MMRKWVTAVAFAATTFSGCGGVELDTPSQAPVDEMAAGEYCLLYRGEAASPQEACRDAQRDAQAHCELIGTGSVRYKTCRIVRSDEFSYVVDLSACCQGDFPE
ncbi:hypothetical protein [Myxococcus xanthus]|uniref:hypothetical protein n=1 Tax=Myxococcus xanthus TaxID=34 RepID=UPI00112982D1|nr:hypothetical protein [Myxococcus xanthus]